MQHFVAPAFAGIFLLFAAFPGQAEETNYFVQKRDDNPDFWSSIRRDGPCAVAGEPTDRVVVPWQEYYPTESRIKNEEGRVVVSIIFDADSCPRSAMVLKSSGFWRLDAATLRLAILTKTTRRTKTDDGQPSWIMAIKWSITGLKR
jgi:TonB family protein